MWIVRGGRNRDERGRTRRCARWVVLLGLAVWLWVGLVGATDPVVPPRVQARLITKIAEYDRALVKRRGTRLILVVQKADNANSASIAKGLLSELAYTDKIAGDVRTARIVSFSSAAELRKQVDREKVAILVFCPGLESQLTSVASALAGATVLTVASGRTAAEHGVVVAVDLVSGLPQLTVNLSQAKRQNVAFRPEFLKLAKVLP